MVKTKNTQCKDDQSSGSFSESLDMLQVSGAIHENPRIKPIIEDLLLDLEGPRVKLCDATWSIMQLWLNSINNDPQASIKFGRERLAKYHDWLITNPVYTIGSAASNEVEIHANGEKCVLACGDAWTLCRIQACRLVRSYPIFLQDREFTVRYRIHGQQNLFQMTFTGSELQDSFCEFFMGCNLPHSHEDFCSFTGGCLTLAATFAINPELCKDFFPGQFDPCSYELVQNSLKGCKASKHQLDAVIGAYLVQKYITASPEQQNCRVVEILDRPLTEFEIACKSANWKQCHIAEFGGVKSKEEYIALIQKVGCRQILFTNE